MRLEGRVTREADRTGIGGAGVAIKPPSTAVLLRTVAHTDHVSGVNVFPRTMNIGAALTLDEDVLGGATSVKFVSVAALAGNPILRLELPSTWSSTRSTAPRIA